MNVQEYLINHFDRKAKDTQRGTVISTMYQIAAKESGVEGTLDDSSTCGAVLHAIYELPDTAKRDSLLTRDLGAGTPGQGFRTSAAILSVIATLFGLGSLARAILSDGDPTKTMSALSALVSGLSDLIKAIIQQMT